MEIDHLHSIQAIDLLWSDPSDTPGITANGNRGAGCCYGPDVVHSFLKRNNLKIIIRAHEVKLEGIGFHADGQLITLFRYSLSIYIYIYIYIIHTRARIHTHTHSLSIS